MDKLRDELEQLWQVRPTYSQVLKHAVYVARLKLKQKEEDGMTNKVMDVKERVEYTVNLNAALLERSGYSEEAYVRVVLNAMVQSPQIAECDQGSLKQALLAAMNAAWCRTAKSALSCRTTKRPH